MQNTHRVDFAFAAQGQAVVVSGQNLLGIGELLLLDLQFFNFAGLNIEAL